MSLTDKQHDFCYLTSLFILLLYQRGYKLTYGDAYRDPRAHGEVGMKKAYGRSRSCHKSRLALDLNLFKDGEYLTETSQYLEAGQLWESLDPRCRWGGRFDDGNHFSFEHRGRQ